MGVNSGGPTTCTMSLLNGLNQLDITVDLLTLDVNHSNDKLIENSSYIKVVPAANFARYGYNQEFNKWLNQNTNYDLYHANAIWQFSTHATVNIAFKTKKPIIISTHGMLYPEGLKKSKWIKKTALFLFQNKDLKKATAFHATSIQEKNYLREFGLTQPIAVIPNAIEGKVFPKPSSKNKTGTKKIGFIGRLVPIKNLEGLLRAWAIVEQQTSDVALEIIGDGSDSYKKHLFNLVKKLKIKNCTFNGFLSGKDLEDQIEKWHFLILPSKSENFGMVVVEALLKGVPVIASKGSPWEELVTEECGWWTDNDPVSLSNSMLNAFTISEEERIIMGQKGFDLMVTKYSQPAVSKMMKGFYSWLLYGGEKPFFVDELNTNSDGSKIVTENSLIENLLPIKITHTISSIDRSAGGTSMFIKTLTEGINNNVSQTIIAMDSPDNIAINSTVKVKLVKRNWISPFFSKELIFNFHKIDTDLYHGHGLWEYPIHLMSKIARQNRIPYIISSHGMLEPWSLKQELLKKKIALKSYQFKDVKEAACIHATSEFEAHNIRDLGYKNPIAIIPNGIDISEYQLKNPNQTIPKKIVVISRIHPKKGIEILIEAWAKLPTNSKQNWTIDIIGNGPKQYIKKLNKQIVSNKLERQITIKEPLYGADKIAAFQNASLFVLPTFSENFGIVIAEALSCGTPVITTKGTPWQDLETNHCGWWIDCGVEPLIEALIKAIQMDNSELELMGLNGRALIEKKYETKNVAKQMEHLYQWVLKKEKKPNFIYE